MNHEVRRRLSGSADSDLSRRQFSLAVAGMAALFSEGTRCFSAETEHPLEPAIRHAQTSLQKAEELEGYEVTFSKKEIVGRSLISQQMRMKVRHNPFSVYMYFEKPNEGREVIFVEGKNNNNLLVHETGIASLIGTLELSPTGSQAMSENRYPITRVGIANMVRLVIKQWEAEKQFGETEVKYFKDGKVGEYTCRVIESSHPQPRKQFRFHRTRLWIDEESGLAVRCQQAGFPSAPGAEPPIIEDYTFTRIRKDVRLTDRDFDTKNPGYRF